jgi:hypothetical protein
VERGVDDGGDMDIEGGEAVEELLLIFRHSSPPCLKSLPVRSIAAGATAQEERGREKIRVFHPPPAIAVKRRPHPCANSHGAHLRERENVHIRISVSQSCLVH